MLHFTVKGSGHMPLDPSFEQQAKQLKVELTRFMMAYRFALDEVETKVKILKEEFHLIHEYNPIEHINTRLKSPESLIAKIQKRQIPLDLVSIKENIQDIAGIRITCSFESDIYRIQEMICKQEDLKVVKIKDYIQQPKESGYRSLHLILQVPVFLSDRTENVYVEMQIRTIAMDFWASLEHKIYYKYNKDIPDYLSNQLVEAAHTAALLDKKMEKLNEEINILKNQQEDAAYDYRSLQTTKLFAALQQIAIPSSKEE